MKKQLHVRCDPKIRLKRSTARKAPCAEHLLAAPKLDKTIADKIKAEAKRWRHEVVAKRFGVSEKTVSDIVNGRTWAEA